MKNEKRLALLRERLLRLEGLLDELLGKAHDDFEPGDLKDNENLVISSMNVRAQIRKYEKLGEVEDGRRD